MSNFVDKTGQTSAANPSTRIATSRLNRT